MSAADKDNHEEENDHTDNIPPSSSSNSSSVVPGVIYLSHVPPYFSPSHLRSLLGSFGPVSRVYLQPETQENQRKRRRKGGSSRAKFVDGWVEFSDKRIAKRVAALLNSQPIGGRKRSYYHDDLWCMKYLSGFSWDQLTEEEAHRRRVKTMEKKQQNAVAEQQAENIAMQIEQSNAKETKTKTKNRNRNKKRKQENQEEQE